MSYEPILYIHQLRYRSIGGSGTRFWASVGTTRASTTLVLDITHAEDNYFMLEKNKDKVPAWYHKEKEQLEMGQWTIVKEEQVTELLEKQILTILILLILLLQSHLL